MFNRDLSGAEVVRRAYEGLVGSHEGVPFRPKDVLKLVIANDSDPHKGTRLGYMLYRSGHVIQKQGKPWCVAFGETDGSRLARRFQCDILTYPLGSFRPEDMEGFFKSSDFNFGVYTGEPRFGLTAMLATEHGELETGWWGNGIACAIAGQLDSIGFKALVRGRGKYARDAVPRLIETMSSWFIPSDAGAP